MNTRIGGTFQMPSSDVDEDGVIGAINATLGFAPTNTKISLTVNDTGEKVLNVISVDGFTLEGESDREMAIKPQVKAGKTVKNIQDFDALSPKDKAKANTVRNLEKGQ